MTQKEMIRQIYTNLAKADDDLRRASVFVSQAREELDKLCLGISRDSKDTKPRSASSH